MYIDYTPPMLLDDEWQWGRTTNNKLKQWVLGWSGKPDVMYASIILTLTIPQPTFRIIVRDRSGLMSLDDRASALDVAMIAAETHILFKRDELCGPT
jgi:hypothetical protein